MTIQLEILGYLALAMFLGGLIGFERERAEKPAGLRTHMLVAGSAALLTGLGDVLVPHFGVAEDLVQADPIRIIEAVITGISFLGAGTIIRRKAEVEGLTTASSLFFAAALGICVALSQFVVAIGATIIVLLTLRALKWFEKKMDI